jgi:hypothetical protein
MSFSLSRDEPAPAAPSCHPKDTPDYIPCQGTGKSASCCANRSQSLLDAFIREHRSCLSGNDCDDHAGCESLTPAIAAATSNAPAIAAAVTVTTSRAASSTGASAVDIAAIPTACPKRKARP